MKIETKAIHVGEKPDTREGACGDVVSPVHLTSTYAREKVEYPTAGYEYTRTANPTRTALEMKLASLENAKFGLAFASGLAAETTIFLSLLKTGDHVVAFDDLYGGSRRLFDKIFQNNFSVKVSFVDARDDAKVKKAITDKTRLIWLETPTNPLLKLCDIETICSFAASKKIPVVVDNTFATPYFQQPLELGADIVLHSTTKYLNGHSDSVGGAVITNNQGYYEKIKFAQNSAGAILSAFDSYLVMRGIKTLAVRMKAHQKNALAIGRFLENHHKVKRVIYPMMESHPQFGLAQKQMSGFSGMLSFELDSDLTGAKNFVENLKYFSLAESLGGIESLIELPALMTHASVPEKERKKIGLPDTLIRLSVGIESLDDLIDDLSNGLSRINK